MEHCGEDRRPAELQAAEPGNRPVHGGWGDLTFWGGTLQVLLRASQSKQVPSRLGRPLFYPAPAPPVLEGHTELARQSGVPEHPKRNSNKLTLGGTEPPQHLWGPQRKRERANESLTDRTWKERPSTEQLPWKREQVPAFQRRGLVRL